MEVVQVVGKGNYTNLLRKFHIFKETHMNNQTNKCMLGYNTIFGTIIQQNMRVVQ